MSLKVAFKSMNQRFLHLCRKDYNICKCSAEGYLWLCAQEWLATCKTNTLLLLLSFGPLHFITLRVSWDECKCKADSVKSFLCLSSMLRQYFLEGILSIIHPQRFAQTLQLSLGKGLHQNPRMLAPDPKLLEGGRSWASVDCAPEALRALFLGPLH